jgi:cation diffusion facilitator family transporter
MRDESAPLRNDKSNRRATRRVFVITLALNLLVASGKIVIGLVTGALAITADGFHSLMDGASNIVALVAMYVAEQPPDDDHPYGHRRFETLAALLIGGALLVVAWEITRGAINQFQEARQPEITATAFAIMVVTLIINIGVSNYQSREAKRLNSELLLADSANTRADVFVTLSVLVSMVLVTLTEQAWIDGVAALVVVTLIGRAAWRIVKRTGSVLVDTAPYPPELLESLVLETPSVDHVIRARSRGTQDSAHIDIDVRTPSAMTTAHTAAIAQAIREKLESSLVGVEEVEVHFAPEESDIQDEALVIRAIADGLGLATHEVRRSGADTIEMHVEVPPVHSLGDAHQLVSQLEYEIKSHLEDVHEVVSHIEPTHSHENGHQPTDTQMARIQNEALGLLNGHYPDVNWHQLRAYTTDHDLTLTLHAGIADDISLESAHELAENAETLLRSHLPQLNRVTIHTEPYQ